MRNPLAVQIKGYPVAGWLVFGLILFAVGYMLWTGNVPGRCDPTGDCIEVP